MLVKCEVWKRTKVIGAFELVVHRDALVDSVKQAAVAKIEKEMCSIPFELRGLFYEGERVEARTMRKAGLSQPTEDLIVLISVDPELEEEEEEEAVENESEEQR